MAKVKRFGQGGSSSDPKRYIKRGPNGAQPASKPPVYQKEVAIRKTSEVSSPNSKGVSSSAKSTSIRPKVYEGELNGGELAKRTKSAGSIGRDAIEGERVVSNRGPSSASSTSGKNVSSPSSSSSSSRAVSPKVYEGEVSGSVPKSASGKSSGNVYEGERVSKPISKTSTISEGSYRELPKSTSSVSSAKDKIVSGLEKSAKKVPAYEAIKGAAASKVDSSLGGMAARGLGRVAAPVAMAMGAKELYDSYKKYDELMSGTKPNMSKKSDSIVDAINAEPKVKASTPDVEIKASASKTPAAGKPALKSGISKPKGPTEGDRARAAIESMRSQYESGDLYNKAGLEKSAEDENARTKTEATENMKKGGMTKRPPKPAKKVPARKFASGGNVSRTSASKRGDGCATKGHTKGKYL